MNPVKRIALVYTSKQRAQEVNSSRHPETLKSDDDEPPDLYSEYDTAETVSAVKKALSRQYEVTAIEGDESVFVNLRELKPDLVFNISEGFAGPNRESHVPIVCEMLGLRYTGSDGLTLGICLDKARTKEILTHHKIPNAKFTVWNAGDGDGKLKRFPLPAIVKPLREGSSTGIRNNSMVASVDALVERSAEIAGLYRQPVLIEEFLPGREFTLGFIGNAPDLEFLPLIEINHAVLPKGANPIYGYEAKWLWDDPADPLPMLICPAPVEPALLKKMRAMVSKAAQVLNIRDWCRADLRLDSAGAPRILELNPLPGILPDPRENSALPAAARAMGMAYDELILKVAKVAGERTSAAK